MLLIVTFNYFDVKLSSVSSELMAYKQVLQLICLYKPLIKQLAQKHIHALGVRAYAAI